MKRALMTLACAALGSACAAPAPAAQQGAAASAPAVNARSGSLGRLFFTPGERAQLDLARMQRKPSTATAAAEPVEPPSAPQTVTYGGLVRRSDGRQMLWINNRLVDEKDALKGLNLKGKIRADGAVTLQAQSGASVDVKVGQSVELQTGRVAETRKPPPEQPAVSPPPAEDAKAAAEAKPATEPKPAATAAKPPAAESGDKKAPPGGMGLKMDLGGRALSSEEAERLSRNK